MKKRSMLLVLILSLVLTIQPVFGADSPALEKSSYAFTHEYDPIPLPSYLLDGEVYVPLHVFSDFFGITVDFDEKTQSVQLDFGAAEGIDVRLQTLSQFVQNTERNIKPSSHKLFVQGNPIDMPMVEIDGYNFMQIDEIAEGYGFRAVKDADAKTIGLTQDELFGSPYLPQFKDYLGKNQVAVKTDDLSALPDVALDPYQVYLVGEQHGIAKNFDIQLYFIKYLSTHQNVRHILSEDSFCNAMLLNRYLETGDTAIIETIVQSARGSSAYSREYYSFYVKLYEFNQTLPENQKLFFVGIDVQHNQRAGIDYLLSLFDEKTAAPTSISAALAALQCHSEEGVREASKLLSENSAAFAAYFGDQIHAFQFGLRSVIQGYDFYVSSDFELREQFIHENFKDYYEAYQIKKCFGMFGGAHTVLNGSFGEIPNLASYMNNEHTPTQGKVCSIMTNYIDCFYMDPTSGESIPVTYSHSASLSRLLNQAALTELALFPLAREGSPFVESGFTGAFQYYLCVKNSPSTTPYGELGHTK